MDYKLRIREAVDHAIKTNYDIYCKQDYIWERLNSSRLICIFGIGKYYQDLKDKGFLKVFFKNLTPIKYVCDNDPGRWGHYYSTNIENALCISPSALSELGNVITLVAVGDYRDIQKQLSDLGIENYTIGDLFLNEYDVHYSNRWFFERQDKILNAVECFHDEKSKNIYVEVLCNRIAPELSTQIFNQLKEENEYFQTNIFHLSDKGGAYVGDTLETFLNLVKFKYEAYYCFELDQTNCGLCQKKIDFYADSRIQLFRVGVYNENKTIYIPKSNGFSSRIDVDRENSILAKVVKLDDVLAGKKVTLISRP